MVLPLRIGVDPLERRVLADLPPHILSFQTVSRDGQLTGSS
ncbi:MAG: hypothetical protein RLZZ244_896, partial [Verrucomicrobiota bacterium]